MANGNTHGDSNTSAEFRKAKASGNVFKFLFSLGGNRTYTHNKPCEWGKIRSKERDAE